MFENRIHHFAPNVGAAGFTPGVYPASCPSPAPTHTAVQLNDIYQAARNRAIEDHEIDKLFNPNPNDFPLDDDFQI